MLKKSAFEESKDGRRKKVDEDDEGADDAVDSENVKELSDLFSTIENEFGDSAGAIDFSVLLEGEHAFNVEEVSDMFSDLEDAVPMVTERDVEDAAVVDEMAALFSSLEEIQDEQDTDSDRDSETVAEEVDEQDAENVEELSGLFTALEEKEDRQQASQDWIASLDVEDVSGLYSELERLEQVTCERKPVVDPRIFVPTFSVRMDGAAAARPLPRVLTTGAFLAGPPGLLLAGPPVRARMDVDGKRKAAASDPSISETRRVCAAKRRRVNGRFVREENSFVSITALQPSP